MRRLLAAALALALCSGCGARVGSLSLDVPSAGVTALPVYPGATGTRAPHASIGGLPCAHDSSRNCPARELRVPATSAAALAWYQTAMATAGYTYNGPALGTGAGWAAVTYLRTTPSGAELFVWVAGRDNGPAHSLVELEATAFPASH